MTSKELNEFTSELEKAGYGKSTTGLTSEESIGYFKSIHNCLVEFRIWDFSKYGITNDPYSADALIIAEDRIDLTITSPKFDIQTTEKIAEEFSKFIKPFVDNYYKEHE